MNTIIAWFTRNGVAANLLMVAIIVGGLLLVSETRFDYDFRALENSDLPAFALDREVNEIMGFSQTPTVVLTTSEPQERRVVDELRERQHHRGDETTIDFVAAKVDLVPLHQE